MFPLNTERSPILRQPEKYVVYFAHTENYRNSAVPFCQRLLNEDHKIENIQKTSLKIILGESYIDYPSSLLKTGLLSLSDRRKSRCLAFAKRCLSNPQTKEIFLEIQKVRPI